MASLILNQREKRVLRAILKRQLAWYDSATKDEDMAARVADDEREPVQSILTRL